MKKIGWWTFNNRNWLRMKLVLLKIIEISGLKKKTLDSIWKEFLYKRNFGMW